MIHETALFHRIFVESCFPRIIFERHSEYGPLHARSASKEGRRGTAIAIYLCVWQALSLPVLPLALSRTLFSCVHFPFPSFYFSPRIDHFDRLVAGECAGILGMQKLGLK